MPIARIPCLSLTFLNSESGTGSEGQTVIDGGVTDRLKLKAFCHYFDYFENYCNNSYFLAQGI